MRRSAEDGVVSTNNETKRDPRKKVSVCVCVCVCVCVSVPAIPTRCSNNNKEPVLLVCC